MHLAAPAEMRALVRALVWALARELPPARRAGRCAAPRRVHARAAAQRSGASGAPAAVAGVLQADHRHARAERALRRAAAATARPGAARRRRHPEPAVEHRPQATVRAAAPRAPRPARPSRGVRAGAGAPAARAPRPMAADRADTTRRRPTAAVRRPPPQSVGGCVLPHPPRPGCACRVLACALRPCRNHREHLRAKASTSGTKA